jgi:hypothetical protein
MVELDNTFLTSDPLGYFMSRAGMIHAWALLARGDQSEGSKEPKDERAQTETGGVVGRPDLQATLAAVMANAEPEALGPLVVSAQVAVDAFALRHHLAEAVTRLFVACVERHTGEQPPRSSLWAHVTDDKRQTHELIGAARKAGTALGDYGFAALILPRDQDFCSSAGSERLEESLGVAADWLEHAVALLRPADLDVNTAHNKVKHGLAVRGRADLRLSLTTQGPDADGNLPLSALRDDVSFTIFGSPVLEFLSRPRVVDLPPQGLEVTQLRLDYRALLAEAAMMALVHGSLFHVAASQHFSERPVPIGLRVAAHPGLFPANAVRPNIAGHQVGLRIPITTPPGGGEPRPAWYGHRDGSGMTLRFTGKKGSGRVVDDAAPDPEG